ncbi:uncharacterized protein LOC127751195 [Frankliniella occidentalis]|uniref:Uncharacterized protein LOC127751195 n=1 Tax=Frankliniella occidentalis TaxID=133901 RepID=A0A9C6X737_FRAOC|nr:uncharacterized protein LOC127751195 [Frankliniella occidentalis]
MTQDELVSACNASLRQANSEITSMMEKLKLEVKSVREAVSAGNKNQHTAFTASVIDMKNEVMSHITEELREVKSAIVSTIVEQQRKVLADIANAVEQCVSTAFNEKYQTKSQASRRDESFLSPGLYEDGNNASPSYQDVGQEDEESESENIIHLVSRHTIKM